MLTIQPINTEGLTEIVHLAHQAWPLAYQNILTDEQIDNILMRIYSLENLQQEMKDGHVFYLASLSEQAQGFASGYKHADTIWLKKLYVLSEAQGHGIGSKLMASIVKHFSPAKELRLNVNSGNLAAQHFYQSKGMICQEEVSVIMGDYRFTDKIYVKSLID